MIIDNSGIGFVFTNFNNSEVTENAIKSIIENVSYEGNPIVVVDNKSNYKNVEILRNISQHFTNVKIIFNNENLGYFKGLNEGIKNLRRWNKKIGTIIIGNNDLVFPKDFLDTVIKKKEILTIHPVISPNIMTMDGVHQNPHVIDKISKVREAVYDLYYSNYYVAKLIKNIANATKRFTDRNDEVHHEEARLIYQGYGACYILTPVFFQYYSELWAPTFLMGEEFFLSKQLERNNFKTYYEPTIVVKHQCHATMDKVPQKKIWKYARDSHVIYRKYVKII